MTGRLLLWIVLVLGLIAGAVFVWPTRYESRPSYLADDGTTVEERVDRITHNLERRKDDGPWMAVPDSMDAPGYSPWTPGGREVDRAMKARDDIQKMQDVTNDEIDKLRKEQAAPGQ